MSPRSASDLYAEMKNMSVEERIRFFSLSLAEMHRELQESISEIESMQRALAESEENHRQLVETAQDAVITINHAGVVINWNQAAERMFGWSAGEAIGNNFGRDDRAGRVSRAARAWFNALSGGSAVEYP